MRSDDARVEVAPGTGWLAHRPGALLWSPDDGRPDGLLAAFLDAASSGAQSRAAVTAAVVDASLDVPPFALVTWSPYLHVVVMGAVDVETDAPSVPQLSGATSRTWVEHGVADATQPVVVLAGAAPVAGTDVGPGVVRAGGFRLTVVPAERRPPPAAPPGAGQVVETVERVVEATEPDGIAPGGAALLDLVTGGDWMDDSIGLTAPGSLVEQFLVDAPAVEAVGARDLGPKVPGRRCPAGHANSPASATCRTCGDLVDVTSSIVELPRPVLATVDAGDGDAVPITGPVIVGRNPDPTAAGVTGDAERFVLPERAGVSRTHVVLRADGWTITATDCGSRRGTELVRAGAGPLRLEPWTAHEVYPGDELLLGGPTSIRITEPSPPGSPEV
jgi:hypothetical protein